MRLEVSVRKALNRGHLTVNVPVFFCLLGIPLITYYLYKKGIIPIWYIAIAVIIGFVLAWIVWSYMITKWRIWAFNNVRNVHELQKKAVKEKLIWDEGNVLEKTEIRTRYDKQKLNKLDRKFEKEDLYREDYSIPPITKIYFSKTRNTLELVISIFIFGLGIYFFTIGTKKAYFLATMSIPIAIYHLYKSIKIALIKEPQLVIDKNGITIKTNKIIEWSNISEEEVTQEDYGKSAKTYLVFFDDDEDVLNKINIDGYNISHRKLEHIIRTYRIRNNKLNGHR